MGLFGRKKKKDLLYEGIAGTAVITAERGRYDGHGEDDTRLSDFGIGNVKWHFTLDVTLDDGRAPYTVEDTFKVPARIEGETAPGVRLPVWADPDDPQRIEINWDKFVADGGSDQFRSESKAEMRTMVHDSLGDENRSMMLDGWVKATELGAMSRSDFDEAVAAAVESGMLTAEEAAGAAARLDGGAPT